MSLVIGHVVEHRTDPALGQGRVASVDTVAGVTRIGVRWSMRQGLFEHTGEQLSRVLALPDRLTAVGPASRVPFQLKVFGRWFEARHALTGELSNQPFQMLPHQVIVTNRVVGSAPDNRAWLIADDVGLGKTIEAGMILEVLRKKALGRFRCLIVTPAGLRPQWQDELARRFGRNFRILDGRIPNDLETVDQLIASIDTLKLAKFKPALQAATPWDLAIFDEAHHLATTTDVLSHKLAQFLRADGKARNILFLSATPHSGNNEHFYNMLRILREDLFPKGSKDYPHVPLKQVMIRNRKSDVTDTQGKKIFKGIAKTQILSFAPTADEVTFYEDLQEYLRTGYKVADRLQKQKDGTRASAMGFLMSTFGKLASSSRAAIESALKNRLVALRGDTESDVSEDPGDERFPGERAAKRAATEGIEPPQPRGKKKKKESLIEGEAAQVEHLLGRLRALGTHDSKLAAFLAGVQTLPQGLKVLIFTEYRATQTALIDGLEAMCGKGTVATINGSMSMVERRKQVDAFNEQPQNPRFMVSTEAGGEGLNMQKSCHTVVNYDLPWNPMVLQQRIGRVYRYGQQHEVVVLNIKVDSTSDAFADQRVYEYLERKIDEITLKLTQVQEGGAEDIRGEVLGQVAAQVSLDELYKAAVEEGRLKAEKMIDSKADHIKQILADPQGMLGIFRGLEKFDITDYEKVAARVRPDHLDFFVRQYLGHEGSPPRTGSDGLISFNIPKKLVEVASAIAKSDPYQAHETLNAGTVERATVDKELAQRTLGCRLLRFGDPAFESMVRHVQHGDFAQGVASLDVAASLLEWQPGEEGTWVLFDLRILRQDGSAGGARILKSELASFVIRKDGDAVAREHLLEALHDAVDGPARVDEVEARRAYELARRAADARLAALYEEVVHEYGKREGVLPQEAQDVALAWVRAT